MTEQQIIEPEARLLVELGQERGVLYEDELAALALEIDLECPVAGERLRRGLRAVDLLLVRGERGSEPSLQAGVDAAGGIGAATR